MSEVQQCTGKERFETPALANAVVKRRNARKGTRAKCQHYRCKFCGFHHIGTIRKWGDAFKQHERDHAVRALEIIRGKQSS